MLKTRLIPILYIKNGLIVRSEEFKEHKNIGNIINEAHRYNEWSVDELIYLDISREKHYDLRRDDHKIVSYHDIEEVIIRISDVCFMPLTFGGGIRSLQDIEMRIKSGADKVSLNTSAFTNPDLIKITAKKFGSQCIVISVDYKIINSIPYVFIENGGENTELSIFDWVRECQKLGAGEILLNSIDRDGKGNGFDIEVIGAVVDSTSLPVIACGGAGDFYDFVELAKTTNVSGIAAGNIFHFTERSYPRAKKILKKEKINVR
jgi:imidazole glycerol-phosphate synthase subunit HisF